MAGSLATIQRLRGRTPCLEAEECFFSNALMGLKPGSATGPMPSTPAYKDECQVFLNEQIRIVNPSLVVSLGGDASERVRKLKPSVQCVRLLHPSARELSLPFELTLGIHEVLVDLGLMTQVDGKSS